MGRRTRKRNRRTKEKTLNKTVLLVIGILLFILIFISVIFSLVNINNRDIIGRVKIEELDVGGLSQDDAKNKLETWINEVLKQDVIVKYQDIEEKIEVEKILPEIDTDKLVKEAISIGKSGSIVKDNYEILGTLLFSRNIENDAQLNQKELDKIINELNSKIPNALKQSNYYVEGDKLIIAKGSAGITVNEEEFKKQLENIIKRKDGRVIELPVKSEIPNKIDLEKIQKEIFKEAKDASIVEKPELIITPEINGMDFAISMEEAKGILEQEQNEYVIPLKITTPNITLEKLGGEAFPSLLGTFSTKYSQGNENRETNLKLASEKIDGTIVLPGEEFSYNKVVGERTIANGYKEAAVYSGGKVVNGIGGGICQISSTLYNAVLYANLEVTERSNHMFLTSYVMAGRDATVSWGAVDFCFKNTRKYPIKVVSDVRNGVVTVQIHGIKEEKEYNILVETKIIETIPYETEYVINSNLKENQEITKQYGANGAISETYKIVKDGETIISTEVLSNDEYSPLESIIQKGPNGTKETGNEPIENSKMNEINQDLLDAIKQLD